MKLNELKPYWGSKKKRKRIGRGEGSGHGGSATKGMKGQRARSGDGKLVGFEGGQMPMLRRIPKRGFSNRRYGVSYSIFNLSWLVDKFGDAGEISPKLLFENGLVKRGSLVKVLGDGELDKPINIKAHAFSKVAVEKIKKVNGKYEILKTKNPEGQGESND